jgi:hypothetical protein
VIQIGFKINSNSNYFYTMVKKRAILSLVGLVGFLSEGKNKPSHISGMADPYLNF